MKNKTYIVAILVFSVGVLMLFGSSYSLIIGNLVSDETYGFDVSNFDVQFSDNRKISISGIPESDVEGLRNSKEFSFTVTNNSNYDVNYRIDILSDSTTNVGDVIHYVYSLNNSQYSEVLSLKNNFTIKQNKVLEKGNSDTYKIKMWLSLDADETYMNKTFSANISLNATQNDYKYATTVIEKLANNHQDNIVKSGNQYRYTGKDSPNYIWFNCQEDFTKGDDYCEKWQIIGSFKNKTEKAKEEYYMLKIVSTNAIADIAFNNDERNGNYSESYIETYANGSYYDKLSERDKSYILNAKWDIGNTNKTNYEESLSKEKAEYYYGNIGLLNVSDYLFIKNNSFLNQDSILFINKNDKDVNILKDTIVNGKSTDLYNFLPCVYLRPDVSIISGDGTFNSPYEITIKYPMNY